MPLFAAAPRAFERGARPPDAGRAQERRDPQRPPRTMRHVDEPDAARSGADQSGELSDADDTLRGWVRGRMSLTGLFAGAIGRRQVRAAAGGLRQGE